MVLLLLVRVVFSDDVLGCVSLLWGEGPVVLVGDVLDELGFPGRDHVVRVVEILQSFSEVFV